jgi:hypothetical protein
MRFFTSFRMTNQEKQEAVGQPLKGDFKSAYGKLDSGYSDFVRIPE